MRHEWSSAAKKLTVLAKLDGIAKIEFITLGRRPFFLAWRPSLSAWRPSLSAWRPSLLGWRPSLFGRRPYYVRFVAENTSRPFALLPESPEASDSMELSPEDIGDIGDVGENLVGNTNSTHVFVPGIYYTTLDCIPLQSLNSFQSSWPHTLQISPVLPVLHPKDLCRASAQAFTWSITDTETDTMQSSTSRFCTQQHVAAKTPTCYLAYPQRHQHKSIYSIYTAPQQRTEMKLKDYVTWRKN